jgi:hypothetical protein
MPDQISTARTLIAERDVRFYNAVAQSVNASNRSRSARYAESLALDAETIRESLLLLLPFMAPDAVATMVRHLRALPVDVNARPVVV